MSKDCLQISGHDVGENLSVFSNIFKISEFTTPSQKLNCLLITDPICSTAWSFDGELMRFYQEYGHALNLKVMMGGLLPSWKNFSRGGINQASDVFCHWQEVGGHHSTPLSGKVWNEDPLSSSFPASKAIICGFLQDNQKGFMLMRRLREAVFIYDKNISKLEVILEEVQRVGLRLERFLNDFQFHAPTILKREIERSEKLNVRLLPTVIAVNRKGDYIKMEGYLHYNCLEQLVRELNPGIRKRSYNKNIFSLFNTYHKLSTKEVSILSQQSWMRTEQQLMQMQSNGLLERLTFDSGDFWIKKT